jgi:hypothetical protein
VLYEPKGPPVLAIAFTYQWLQISSAPLYLGFTGRAITDMLRCDYPPMVLLGYAGICVLAIGLHLGRGAGLGRWDGAPLDERTRLMLIAGYFVTTLSSGITVRLAGQNPSLNQVVLSLSFVRMGVLLLLFRSLVKPTFRAQWIALLLVIETAIGLTGFFSDWRDGIVLLAVAMVEVFDRKNLVHWVSVTLLAVAGLMLSVMWTGIKEQYRQDFRDPEFAESPSERLDRVYDLAQAWARNPNERLLVDVDKLVSRSWAIHVQARALERVPREVPYEDGRLFGEALMHILMPRLIFPDKPRLDDADNEATRKYGGLKVAKRGTSVAFGYVGEAYVDFGYLGMFAPILLFGLAMGYAYRRTVLSLHNQHLAVIVSSVFWSALFAYERSWAKMMGTAGALLIVIGGGALAIDRFLRRKRS